MQTPGKLPGRTTTTTIIIIIIFLHPMECRRLPFQIFVRWGRRPLRGMLSKRVCRQALGRLLSAARKLRYAE